MRTRTCFPPPCVRPTIRRRHAGAGRRRAGPHGDLAKLQGQWTAMFGPQKNIPMVVTIKGTDRHAHDHHARRPGARVEGRDQDRREGQAVQDDRLGQVHHARRRAGPREPGHLQARRRLDHHLQRRPGQRAADRVQGRRGGPAATVRPEPQDARPRPPRPAGDLAKLQGRWTGQGRARRRTSRSS